MSPRKKTSATANNKTGSSSKAVSAVDFQKQFEALENITEDFESGKYDLETGLKKFEEGLQIAQTLKDHLETVENRIETIKSKYNEFAQDNKDQEE